MRVKCNIETTQEMWFGRIVRAFAPPGSEGDVPYIPYVDHALTVCRQGDQFICEWVNGLEPGGMLKAFSAFQPARDAIETVTQMLEAECHRNGIATERFESELPIPTHD